MSATVAVPGSKSVTNRALVLGALADGTSRLRRPLRSRDTELMAGGLRTLGVRVYDAADSLDGDWQVPGEPGPLQPVQPARVEVGNAGTVARFLPPVACLAAGPVFFDGDPRVRQRPVGPLLAALRRLGADLDDGGRGALPVAIRGQGELTGGAVSIDAAASSQLVSGLLLVAPRCARGLDVRHVGASLPSRPHLAMTVAMLRTAGAEVDDSEPNRWRVAPGPLSAVDYDIESDLSSAAPFLAAAAVTAGEVRLAGWPAATYQPGARFPDLLTQMGARVTRTGDELVVCGPDRLDGLDADLADCGELTPVLAAVAALASSPSRLCGVGHLRGQETDRLAALATELRRLGGDVSATSDGLLIRPRPLHRGRFHTYDDHRLAMAAAVLGLVVDGVLVMDVATTGKTLPGFVDRWEAMVAGRLLPGTR